MFETAKWLKINNNYYNARVFSCFSINRCIPVKIRIIGLGFYRLKINGKQVGDELFSQPLTDYCERDLTNTIFPVKGALKHYILYNEYDITDKVTVGINKIEVNLGCGWFKNNDRKCEGDYSFSDSLMLVYEIVSDGQIVAVSDESARYLGSGYLYCGLYNGIKYDFSREREIKEQYRRGDLLKPEITTIPNVSFEKNCIKTDRVVYEIRPKKIVFCDDFSIYDCGKNLVGFATFKSSAEQKQIVVDYAEDFKNGDIVEIYSEIDNFNQSQKDVYLNALKNDICVPKFVFYGFRYVKIYGQVSNVKVKVVKPDINRLSDFKSSDKTLNWFYNASINSITDNIHLGVPTDCPHREKFGYTGDGNLLAETVMLNFDAKALYRKWIKDIVNAQMDDGYIPNTAPYMGGGGGIGGWGSSIIHIPKIYYDYYGDIELLKTYFPSMKKYLNYVCSLIESDGLIYKDKYNANPLGDWSYPDRDKLPIEFVNTYFFVRSYNEFKCIADILGETVDENYIRAAEKAKSVLIEKFYDKTTGDFCGGEHGANAFAIDIGIGSDKTFISLCEKYNRLGCFDTGIFGTDLLFKVLTENKKFDLIYKLLSSKKYPSFGFWCKQGATTLWEDWSGKFASTDCKITSSKNHAMFAASVKYLFYSLCGIKRDNKGIVVEPRRIKGIKRLTCGISNEDGSFVRLKILNRKGKTYLNIKSNCSYRLGFGKQYKEVFGNTKIITK